MSWYLSYQDHPQIHRSTHETAQSGVVWIMFFSPRSWFAAFKDTHAKELTGANCHARQLLKTVAE